MIDEKLIFTGLEYTEKTALLNFCYKKLKELDYLIEVNLEELDAELDEMFANLK